jgi:hypothetical protein
MATMQELEKRIVNIEERNRRVELDKTWETSWVRRVILIVCTYLAIGFYLNVILVSEPWLNAIVPTIGFFLSTLTLPMIKNVWLRKKNV